MPPEYFTLDSEHNLVPEEDLLAWALWFETANRQVALTQIGPYQVSTVFLGINHSFLADGPPILFETMVFRADDTWLKDRERCETWAEALAQHEEMCARIRRRGQEPERSDA